MPRVLISQVKAVPAAGYGFIPRCIPWEVGLIQDPETGIIEYQINVNTVARYMYGFPDANGNITFSPAGEDMADNPVPVLAIAVVESGEVLENRVLREIVSSADWAWLNTTHGITEAKLKIPAGVPIP
jgi:hypothetical protein